VSRSYAYTVPEEWDIANCEVVAFVSEYQGEIYQARSVIADGGFTTAVSELTSPTATGTLPFPVPASDRVLIPLSADENQATIRIVDDLGHEVRRERCSSGTLGLDVRAWPVGMYSFRVTSSNGLRNGRFAVLH